MYLFPSFLYLHLARTAFHISLTRAATRLILRLLHILKQIGCHRNPEQFRLGAKQGRLDVLLIVV
jgi:hypothetical protein